MIGFATICLSTSVQSSQALHQRCQRFTVSLLFGSSRNTDEFQQWLLAAYVDLCKAFASVNRNALWRILCLRGVPPKLINLMAELYSGTESAVRCCDTISDLFPVVTGICQGCVYGQVILVLLTGEFAHCICGRNNYINGL